MCIYVYTIHKCINKYIHIYIYIHIYTHNSKLQGPHASMKPRAQKCMAAFPRAHLSLSLSRSLGTCVCMYLRGRGGGQQGATGDD